jgi:hypothetical protein
MDGDGIDEAAIEERSFVAALLWMTAKNGITPARRPDIAERTCRR